MNKLPIDKQVTVLTALSEGCSIRSTERMTGIHRDTIMRLQARIGDGCEALMDQRMVNLPCRVVQVDEVWGFIGKKKKNLKPREELSGKGDVWTWVALDAETKVVPTYYVGDRNARAARLFMMDLAQRVSGRIQLSSDGLAAYVEAVYAAFGSDVDYGQIVKSYEAEEVSPGRYSPPHVVAVSRKAIIGQPEKEAISTSLVERQNLNIRMGMRRMTRLTNAFSKTFANHKAATDLYFAFYNFCRVHKTLRTTPAMAAGVSNHVWSMEELIKAAEEAK
jgi:IS1 family transposase